KGVGEGAVEDIIKERDARGEFKDIWDFAERINLQSVNKKNWEALVYSGGFDSISGCNRSSFFNIDKNELNFVENLIRYGNLIQNEKNMAQQSLFGSSEHITIQKPKPVISDEWPSIIKLEHEKNLIGMYLTAHPLDDFKLEIDTFCTKGFSLSMLEADIAMFKGRELVFAGMVTEAGEGLSKKGTRFATMVIADYNSSYKISFWSNDFISFGNFCRKGLFLMVKGKVAPRYRKDDGNEMLEFKVSSIELLNEVRKNKVKNITIEIGLNNITDSFLGELTKMCELNKGQTHLSFKISDIETKTSLHLFSRNVRVDLGDEFIEYLNSKEGIIFKIN
ncbi:MAG: DNA polymerase III subunit alpha, partial [Prolixibacteraceae bacterium]|nr:DNA polymerase III subunit alpha [Prolixibacteraceae bacterium]